MPWKLDTPYNPGDFDTAVYDEVKITRQSHDSLRGTIHISLEYGTTTDDEWLPGLTPTTKPSNVMIEEREYIDMVTTHTTNDGELTYQAVKRALYEWLAANGNLDAGSII